MAVLQELDLSQPQYNFLIAGKDARADALGWKIRQSPLTGQLAFAGGNAGTMRWGENLPIAVDDIEGIVGAARNSNSIIVVSSEDQLAAGLVNAANEAGVYAYGPTKEAAKIESSKWWAIQLMDELDIPHPVTVALSDYQAAVAWIQANPPERSRMRAYKDNRLKQGKGVGIIGTTEEAYKFAYDLRDVITSSDPLLVQYLEEGPEFTVIGNSDGKGVVSTLATQDHKRLLDGDKGPNTGGMGAYTPTPDHIASKEDQLWVERRILQPVVTAMDRMGMPFRGALYAGLIKTLEGIKVIEFNCRWGDPEAEVLLKLMKTDIVRLITESIAGRQRRRTIEFRNGAAVGIVLASEGYPVSPLTGRLIEGLEQPLPAYVDIFHAGTKRNAQGGIETAGGRVLLGTAIGKDVLHARNRVDQVLKPGGIWFPSAHRRYQIGQQAINQ